MPRFYFDMVEDGVTTHDNDGVEMPSAKLARRAATAIVTVIAYDRATKNLAPDFAVVIRDASGVIDTRDERAQGRAAAERGLTRNVGLLSKSPSITLRRHLDAA